MARAAINRLAVSDVKIENLGDNFIYQVGILLPLKLSSAKPINTHRR